MERRQIILSIVLIALTGLVIYGLGWDIGTCFSMLIIISGLVIAGIQTASAASSVGPKSPVNTAMISPEIVREDSKARWRTKMPEEYSLALVLIVTGAVLFIISAMFSLLSP